VTAVAVHHRLDGPPDAPALVLAGSLGTTADMWQPQLATLGRSWRVVRYDQRGHGGSPVPAGPYRIDELGEDLLALLDRLRLGRVDVAGLSLGGMAGMWLAAHAADRVHRLALLCTSARLGPPETWQERAATVRAHGTAAIADMMMGRWFTAGFGRRNPGVVAWARQMLTGIPAEGYAGCCEAIAAMDLEPQVGRIHAPTLVVAGSSDPATPVEHAERIVAGVPGARLAVVDAAHLANVEQPELVTELLTGFFAGGAG
jgi:3-oxoadipate enol-lactonase